MKGVAEVGLFAQIDAPTLFILAVLVLLISLLLWRSHRYLARQPKGNSRPVRSRRPESPQPGPLLDAPDEAIRWEVRMHETARDLSGQLDSKMGALEHLIGEADRAAARLEAALEAARRLSDQPPTAETATGQPSDASPRLDPLPPEPADQAEALKSEGGADRAAHPGNTLPEQSRSRHPAEQRYEEIYLLADYGFDAAEIARRVGSPLGEVELILGLRKER